MCRCDCSREIAVLVLTQTSKEVSRVKKYVYKRGHLVKKEGKQIYNYLSLHSLHISHLDSQLRALHRWLEHINSQNVPVKEDRFAELNKKLKQQNSTLKWEESPLKTILTYQDGLYFMPVFYALRNYFETNSVLLCEQLKKDLSLEEDPTRKWLDEISKIDPSVIESAGKDFTYHTVLYCSTNMHEATDSLDRKIEFILSSVESEIDQTIDHNQVCQIIVDITKLYFPVRTAMKKRYIWNPVKGQWQECPDGEYRHIMYTLFVHLKSFWEKKFDSDGFPVKNDVLTTVNSLICSNDFITQAELISDDRKWVLRTQEGVLDLLTGHVGGIVPEHFLSTKVTLPTVSCVSKLIRDDLLLRTFRKMWEETFLQKYFQRLTKRDGDDYLTPLYEMMFEEEEGEEKENKGDKENKEKKKKKKKTKKKEKGRKNESFRDPGFSLQFLRRPVQVFAFRLQRDEVLRHRPGHQSGRHQLRQVHLHPPGRGEQRQEPLSEHVAERLWSIRRHHQLQHAHPHARQGQPSTGHRPERVHLSGADGRRVGRSHRRKLHQDPDGQLEHVRQSPLREQQERDTDRQSVGLHQQDPSVHGDHGLLRSHTALPLCRQVRGDGARRRERPGPTRNLQALSRRLQHEEFDAGNVSAHDLYPFRGVSQVDRSLELSRHSRVHKDFQRGIFENHRHLRSVQILRGHSRDSGRIHNRVRPEIGRQTVFDANSTEPEVHGGGDHRPIRRRVCAQGFLFRRRLVRRRRGRHRVRRRRRGRNRKTPSTNRRRNRKTSSTNRRKNRRRRNDKRRKNRRRICGRSGGLSYCKTPPFRFDVGRHRKEASKEM